LRWDYRLRHYWGLSKTEEKLRRLLKEFEFRPISDELANRIEGLRIKG